MTDNQPAPQYGVYSANPIPTAYPYPTPATPRPRRIWDVVLTSILLAFGAYSVLSSLRAFSNFGSIVASAFEQRGLGAFSSFGLASGVGFGLNVFGVVLLGIAILVSVRLLRSNRLAFWVPLSAGVLNVIIIVVGMIAVMVSDPAFTDQLSSY
jgi:Family of unknown function (DUF6264)